MLLAQLSKLGYEYHVGGYVIPLSTKVAAKTLTQIIHEQGLRGVEDELDRISKNLEGDPAAAVTASCALLEALFQSYIADEALDMPSDRSILPLWKIVRDHLKLNPTTMPNESLRKVVSGLASIVDGIASLRTAHGSAHGRDSRIGYRIEPRHARLVANNASTLATFVLEVANAKAKRT